jgi:hypothetical protein
MSEAEVTADKLSRKKSLGYIRLEYRPSGVYASHYTNSYRDAENHVRHDIIYLGKVIDEAKGIYKNRERGIFTYSLEERFGEIPATEIPASEKNERSILIFGDSWLLDEVLKKSGYMTVLEQIMPEEKDTLLAYIASKLLDPGFSDVHARDWLTRSYASVLYPKANLYSQRISEFLTRLGGETNWRTFFNLHLNYLSKDNQETKYKFPILIDSTGLPNDINIPLTAVNNHNGEISNEIRLIYVVDRITSMPIYFNYIHGNVVDVATLLNIIHELTQYNIDIKCLIVDAGYFSEENIKTLFLEKIPFIIRMSSNRKIYKDLIDQYADNIQQSNNLVTYRNRILYVVRAKIDIYDNKAYAFIILDCERKNDEFKKYVFDAMQDNESREIMDEKIKKQGFFIILSSEEIEINEILPLYYTRQKIEQVFDVGKNNAELLPLRSQKVETFRGHLMASFIATTIYLITNDMLKKSKFTALYAFHMMKSLMVKIYDNAISIQPPTKQMKDVASALSLILPNIDGSDNLMNRNSVTKQTKPKKPKKPKIKNSK